MRKVKYQAWIIPTGEMKAVTNLCFDEEGNLYGIKTPDTPINDCVSISTVELRGFTGLCDENGKEIYEGDIVSLMMDDGEVRYFEVAIQTVIREVVCHPSFDDATAKVAITGVVFKWNGFELFPCVNDGVHDNEQMVVIGNIYENPDLVITA